MSTTIIETSKGDTKAYLSKSQHGKVVWNKAKYTLLTYQKETTQPQCPIQALPTPWVLSTAGKLLRYLRRSYLLPDRYPYFQCFVSLIFSTFLSAISLYLYSLVHTKTQYLKCLFGADNVTLQQLQQVISNGGGGQFHNFSLKAVSIGQHHKWTGLFPLGDVNRGRIWNSSVWETLYEFFRLQKKEWVFLLLQACCFHTLRPHNCAQTPYKSDFCIIGPL